MIQKKINLKTLIIAGLSTVTVSCNIADKRSSMEKDSLGNDTATKDYVGGVETFETNIEEDAAGHLKDVSSSLVMQDSLLKVALTSAASNDLKTYAKKAQERIKFHRKNLESFANKNKVLLNNALRTEQIDSLKWLSRKAGTAFDHPFFDKISSEMRNGVEAYKKAKNARQQRVKNFVNDELPRIEKELELLSEVRNKVMQPKG